MVKRKSNKMGKIPELYDLVVVTSYVSACKKRMRESEKYPFTIGR